MLGGLAYAHDRTEKPKVQQFAGADISSSNLIDIKNIEIIDAS